MKNKKERYGLSVSYSKEEHEMVERLRKKPYYINMSEFIRESIKELYKKRIGK